MVTGALQLYFSGESLRNTQKFFKLQGVKVSHQTIYNWISEVRRVDGEISRPDYATRSETHGEPMNSIVKVKGDMKYLFAMMDNDTRFWIAQQVADKKGTST